MANGDRFSGFNDQPAVKIEAPITHHDLRNGSVFHNSPSANADQTLRCNRDLGFTVTTLLNPVIPPHLGARGSSTPWESPRSNVRASSLGGLADHTSINFVDRVCSLGPLAPAGSINLLHLAREMGGVADCRRREFSLAWCAGVRQAALDRRPNFPTGPLKQHSPRDCERRIPPARPPAKSKRWCARPSDLHGTPAPEHPARSPPSWWFRHCTETCPGQCRLGCKP